MKHRYNNTKGGAAIGVIIIILIIAVVIGIVIHFINKGKSDTVNNGYYVNDGKLYCYHDGKASEISDYSGEDTSSVRLSSDGKYIFYSDGSAVKASTVDGKSAEVIAENADSFEINADGTKVVYTVKKEQTEEEKNDNGYSKMTVYCQSVSKGKADGDAEVLVESCTDVVSLCGGSDKVSVYYIDSHTETLNTSDYITDIPSTPHNNAQWTLMNDLKSSTIDVTFYSLFYVTEGGDAKTVDDDIVYDNATNDITYRSASDAAAVVYQRGTFEPQVSFTSITGTNIIDAEGQVKIAFNVPTAWYIATGESTKEIGSIAAQTQVSALSDDGKVLYYYDNYSTDAQYEYADLMRLDLVGSNQPAVECSQVYTGSDIKFISTDIPVYLMYEDIDKYKLGVGSEKRSAEGTLVNGGSIVTGGSTAAFLTTDGDLYIYTDGGESKAVKVDSSVSSICCVTDSGSAIYKLESGDVMIVDSTGENSEKVK